MKDQVFARGDTPIKSRPNLARGDIHNSHPHNITTMSNKKLSEKKNIWEGWSIFFFFQKKKKSPIINQFHLYKSE